MSRADLILKLEVGKDKRTVAPLETGGHISYFFRTFSSKLKDCFKLNLLYTAIFALPLIFSVFILPLLVNNYVYADKSFVNNYGIGFPNVADSLNQSISWFYQINRFLVYPCIIVSVFIAFVGLSGVFHVSRGFMWGEKVKVKSFFRGIKSLWKPFMIIGAFVTAIVAGMLYGIGWHAELMKTASTNGGSWVVFILCILVGLGLVCVLQTLLPSLACYNLGIKKSLKNSFLFIGIMPFPAIFIGAVSIAIGLLSLVGSVLLIILGACLVFFGFFFYAMMWTTFGQYLFDAFICPQVDENGMRKEVVVKKQNNQGATKSYDKAGGVHNSQPSNNKKKANKNQYKASYKRASKGNTQNNNKNNKNSSSKGGNKR